MGQCRLCSSGRRVRCARISLDVGQVDPQKPQDGSEKPGLPCVIPFAEVLARVYRV